MCVDTEIRCNDDGCFNTMPEIVEEATEKEQEKETNSVRLRIILN
jgi:hypothetical protein